MALDWPEFHTNIEGQEVRRARSSNFSCPSIYTIYPVDSNFRAPRPSRPIATLVIHIWINLYLSGPVVPLCFSILIIFKVFIYSFHIYIISFMHFIVTFYLLSFSHLNILFHLFSSLLVLYLGFPSCSCNKTL